MTEVMKRVCIVQSSKVIIIDACRKVPSCHKKNEWDCKALAEEDDDDEATVQTCQTSTILSDMATINESECGGELMVIYSCGNGGVSFAGPKIGGKPELVCDRRPSNFACPCV